MSGLPRSNRQPSPSLAVLAWLGMALASAGLVAPPCRAQAPANDVIYTRQAHFRIPFEIEAGKPRLREIELYVSTDRGRTWYRAGATTPEARGFEFRAVRDGQYWFTVRTVEQDGQASPQSLEGARPQLKVYVDTQPQVVFVRPVPAREGQIAVEWEIRDDTLDLRTLRLDYRPPGGTAWNPLPCDPTLTGQRSYNIGAVNGLIEVRLSISDRNGNPREATTTINPGGLDNRSPAAPGDANRNPAPVGSASARLVNSKRISLNYKIDGTGKSGVSVVELWYTRDGRNWQKGREQGKDHKPPFDFEVDGEGIYGFTLVVRSGVGFGDRPPQAGDPPQVWVEVDLTKPVVQLHGVEVGRGTDLGNLTITWRATDRNLSRQPITISYAESKEGPWTTVAPNLENTGRYVWRMKDDVPFQFFIRVEAADRAGNIGSAETEQHVVVDLSQPKGQILGVEPVGRP